MKVLYVTNYQGSAVVAQRGHRRNRTLGPSKKIELFVRGLVARGHEVQVVSPATVSEDSLRWYPGFDVPEPECGGARVCYLPGLDLRRANLLVASQVLGRFLARVARFDVLFLYNLEWYFLRPVLAYCARTGTPLVVEYEDDALAPVGAQLQAWHVRRGRRAIAAARGAVTGVVAVSPELLRQLDVGNGVVIPGLIGDDSLALPIKAGPASQDPLRLIYTGGINREKGPDLLLEAADGLGFPVEVDVVGAGRDLVALRAQATRCRVPVRVHGEVGREALVNLLGRADVAVNPHRMPQGRRGQIFPFKMVEYIGAGLPVVTSRLGEFPLPDKGSLLEYDRDDAGSLAEALTGARERLEGLRTAAVKARAWVAAEYSPAGAAEKLERVFVAARAASGARQGAGADERREVHD
ncbi:MAG: glycosyltransferase family 4 protein [Anaeromyxobacter sp.]|nr:glycosyltransferase family 4 protein [Anaeromyxobacter sp.]